MLRSSSWRDIFTDGWRSSGDSWLDKSFTVLTFKLIGAISSLNAWKKRTQITSSKNVSKGSILNFSSNKMARAAERPTAVAHSTKKLTQFRSSATRATSWRANSYSPDTLKRDMKRKIIMWTFKWLCISFKFFILCNLVLKNTALST